jgi:hypothetical protein
MHVIEVQQFFFVLTKSMALYAVAGTDFTTHNMVVPLLRWSVIGISALKAQV